MGQKKSLKTPKMNTLSSEQDLRSLKRSWQRFLKALDDNADYCVRLIGISILLVVLCSVIIMGILVLTDHRQASYQIAVNTRMEMQKEISMLRNEFYTVRKELSKDSKSKERK